MCIYIYIDYNIYIMYIRGGIWLSGFQNDTQNDTKTLPVCDISSYWKTVAHAWVWLVHHLQEISDIFLAKWFKVTFLSPSWRSLNLPKGSLNHPKKVTKKCLEGVILHYFASLTVLFFSNCMVVKLIQAQVPWTKNSRRLQVTLNGREKQYVNTSEPAGFPGLIRKFLRWRIMQQSPAIFWWNLGWFMVYHFY